MIKNIVLDMGNVLLKYDPEIPLLAFCETEEARGMIRKELFEGPEWEMGDLGVISDFDRYELVRERVPESLWKDLRKCCADWDICMTPIEGAMDFCLKMREKGYPLYVLSNASDKFYDYFPRFSSLDFFDGIVVSADVHIVKPSAGIYTHLLETYHLKPEECLFIDDRLNNVEGARAVGMQGHLFTGDFDAIIKEYNLI